ncbi:hypothetical protein Maq22A_c23240 [Methylobacterium aquaticum]|uniref:Uncharacterized protein n=1 Tax=Methylobacterium aquaticum TaxID=270351 RepID=A0A0C6FQN6_9HYPH|nr:hypothetical protein Maq22A_c23240 [Methylobacterium aquaticum]
MHLETLTRLQADHGMRNLAEFGRQSHDVVEALLRDIVEGIVGPGHVFVRQACELGFSVGDDPQTA